jgi:hypothetical protein
VVRTYLHNDIPNINILSLFDRRHFSFNDSTPMYLRGKTSECNKSIAISTHINSHEFCDTTGPVISWESMVT